MRSDVAVLGVVLGDRQRAQAQMQVGEDIHEAILVRAFPERAKAAQRLM